MILRLVLATLATFLCTCGPGPRSDKHFPKAARFRTTAPDLVPRHVDLNVPDAVKAKAAAAREFHYQRVGAERYGTLREDYLTILAVLREKAARCAPAPTRPCLFELSFYVERLRLLAGALIAAPKPARWRPWYLNRLDTDGRYLDEVERTTERLRRTLDRRTS